MARDHDQKSNEGHIFGYRDGPDGFGNYCALCNGKGANPSEAQLKAMTRGG